MQHYQTPAPASSNVAPKMPAPPGPPSATARAALHARRLELLERTLALTRALERTLNEMRAEDALQGTLESRPTPRTDRSRSRSRGH
jgi:hypothetical protein